MSGEWYYQLMGDVVGLLHTDELVDAVVSGNVQSGTYVRKGELQLKQRAFRLGADGYRVAVTGRSF